MTRRTIPHPLIVAAALGAALPMLPCDPASAHDEEFTMPGRQLVLREGRTPRSNRLQLFVRGAENLDLRHDPRSSGMSLLLSGSGSDPDDSGHSGVLELDPAFWRMIGRADSPLGYRYRDRDGTVGGITSALLRPGQLTITGRGENVSWVPTGPQDVVHVQVTLEEEVFCAEFGGTIGRNEAGDFRARNAAAPDECAEAVCGNGELEPGEACDDGNTRNNDGCDSACRLAPCELEAGVDSTFEAIQRAVFASPAYGCANAICHGGAQQGNLSLLDALAYDQLVGVPSFGSTDARVEPGEPSQSFLYQLLAAATLGTPIPGGGTPMPTGGGPPLTAEHLEGIERWIRGGAPRDEVVEGTAELLGSCLPPADPLTIPVPPPAVAGVGVQFRQTPWPLPASSEDEICMSTYYDLTATNLVPDFARVPCPPVFQNVNNPAGECFLYHRQVLRQDPQSHHSIIHIYTGQYDAAHAGFGPYTRKLQDPDDPRQGTPCDPKDVDPATGYAADCSGGISSAIACIGYGPPDFSQGGGFGGGGGGTAPSFSGSQEPFYDLEFAPGTFAVLPMSGVITWNSHAFNLTSQDSTMSQYLDLEFAGLGDQLFPVRGIFDSESIFVQNVPPFETREYCRTYTVPPQSRLFQLSSHTHRHGKRFRIWAPPNTPCIPGQPSCVPDASRPPIYLSTEYTDPVQLQLDPPVEHDDPNVASRTYLYCSLYDNGAELDSQGQPRHPVKRQSTSPEPPLVFGLPLGPGGPCSDATVACMDGPRKGQLCGGDDAFCDGSPGAGDGACDACPVRGGVTTEDEMFILLGSYYIDDGSTAGPEITPANVGALGLKWSFPLASSVTGGPVVAGNLAYAAAWNGIVYAIHKETGAVAWSYDTGAAGVLGVQARVTVAPGGQVLVGDSMARLHFLDGQTGAVFWNVSLGNPAVDHVWSAATVANGRAFVGIASHSDNPCTNGRTVAVDLATGAVLWTRQNVPTGVCSDDTAVACTADAQCGSGICEPAVGAGVTGQVAVDASGDHVYVNTVGCFTFPSVGDSDSIMKLDAATGATEWIRRVDPPEQFGFCDVDPSIDCGSDASCGGGTCTPKPFYHDFGFLNGPHLVEVDDGMGGLRTLVISGSKNGTLYALDEADGSIAWTHEVQPKPVSPGFAGFGLFNGGMAVADGRIHAALYQFSPPLLPAPDHLMTFDARDGSLLWSDEIGVSWGHVGVSNGVVFVGTNVAGQLYAYDAASGARLASFPLPAPTVTPPQVDGTSLYLGYGLGGPVGGVRAYILP